MKPYFQFLKVLIPILFLNVSFSCKKETKTDTPVSETPAKQDSISFAPPIWSKNLGIYEVNIRQYSEEGTFDAFAKDLPRVKELGVGILWLMPIHQIGEKNRKGTLGSYYAVKDYRSVSSDYGTIENFKNFVQQAHSMGLYVIIDWVANHTAWDHAWVTEHPEFYTKDSLGKMKPPVPDWQDVVELDFENKELRKVMIEDMKFWLKEADIDGFRCDVAGEVPNDFWKDAYTELFKVKPIFMLAEAENPSLLENGFHASYGWEFHHIFNKIYKKELNASAIDTYFTKENTQHKPTAYRMYFIDNHDENSWNGTIKERLGDSFKAAFVLSSTVKGSFPLIYNGDEVGLDKRLNFFEKDAIDWKKYASKNVDLPSFYKTLLDLKKAQPALWNGEFGGEMVRLSEATDNQIYAFVREKDASKIIVIVNLSNKNAKINLKNSLLTGSYKGIFDGKNIELNGALELNLKSWGYEVYVRN
jgi:1,4-alpha-glucan branching enzyme